LAPVTSAFCPVRSGCIGTAGAVVVDVAVDKVGVVTG
jgi:hypothetical protein